MIACDLVAIARAKCAISSGIQRPFGLGSLGRYVSHGSYRSGSSGVAARPGLTRSLMSILTSFQLYLWAAAT
jgi:hypothetical protein